MKSNYIILLVLLIGLSSCGTIKGLYGKSSIKEDVSLSKITQVDKQINVGNINRLNYIGEYSYGIQYSLDQTNNIILIEQLGY
jgi:hypothetical protein